MSFWIFGSRLLRQSTMLPQNRGRLMLIFFSNWYVALARRQIWFSAKFVTAYGNKHALCITNQTLFITNLRRLLQLEVFRRLASFGFICFLTSETFAAPSLSPGNITPVSSNSWICRAIICCCRKLNFWTCSLIGLAFFVSTLCYTKVQWLNLSFLVETIAKKPI